LASDSTENVSLYLLSPKEMTLGNLLNIYFEMKQGSVNRILKHWKPILQIFKAITIDEVYNLGQCKQILTIHHCT
jgi:hypothetical protein